MTPSLTRAVISDVSRSVAASALGQLGFRRKGSHLVRPSGDLFHAVHFQASQWGSRTEGQFTINVAVPIPAVYEFWTGRPFPKNPATALFPLQQRLGLLTPERRDRWWSVGAAVDREEIAGEIVGLLQDAAMPFFAQYPNSAAVLHSLRQDQRAPGLSSGQVPLVHAILAKCAGSETEAASALNGALAQAAATPFRATVLLISHRLGLEPSDA